MIRLARSAALAAVVLLAMTPLAAAMAQGNSENHRNDQNGEGPGNNGQGNAFGETRGGGEEPGDDDAGGGGEPQGASGPADVPTPPPDPVSAPGTEALAPPHETGSDSERALEAVRSHRALPLEDIVETATEGHPGKLIDARLITVEDFLLYELKLLEPDGDVRTVYYYARSGIEVRGN